MNNPPDFLLEKGDLYTATVVTECGARVAEQLRPYKVEVGTIITMTEKQANCFIKYVIAQGMVLKRVKAPPRENLWQRKAQPNN